MIRFIIGIMLITSYVLGSLGHLILGRFDDFIFTAFSGFFVFGLPGMLLAYPRYKIIAERRLIIRRASELIKEDGQLEIGKLAAEIGVTTSEVREEILTAQEKGKLPSGIAIV